MLEDWKRLFDDQKVVTEILFEKEEAKASIKIQYQRKEVVVQHLSAMIRQDVPVIEKACLLLTLLSHSSLCHGRLLMSLTCAMFL